MNWIERRLGELADDGFFEDLPGTGKPIADLDTQYSPTWWAARWVKRDAARQDAIEMRSKVAADIDAAFELPLDASRERLREIAKAVDELNRLLDSHQQLPPVDVDAAIIRRSWP